MSLEKYGEEANAVAREESLQHASLAVLRSASSALPGTAAWIGGKIGPAPTVVYDINGKELFRDYVVSRGGTALGYVRTAASKILGSPTMSLELGGRTWDLEIAVKQLGPRMKKAFPGAAIGAPTLVCYSYPKLGVMFEVNVAGKTTRQIYDVASLAHVPELTERTDREGFYAWSFYGALSEEERALRMRRYRQEDEARLAISSKKRASYLMGRNIREAGDIIKLPFKMTVTKQLAYCSHYAFDHARGHHCFSLHGQQVDDYCSVATAQMILCYYRYYHTQDEIAPELNYSHPGGCPPDQNNGYAALTNQHLTSSYDSSPTWQKGRDEIDALRPFKSGIAGHARACAGYSYTRWLLPSAANRSLYIYDPWPWNADFALGGTITWEDWGSVGHTNYVTVQIKTS